MTSTRHKQLGNALLVTAVGEHKAQSRAQGKRKFSIAEHKAQDIDGELNSRKGTDKSWGCEIAVPLKDFDTAPNCPPKPGDVWRINLYRIDHRKDKSEYSAWSTTGKIDFHIPQRFEYLKFVKETALMPAVSKKGKLTTTWSIIKSH